MVKSNRCISFSQGAGKEREARCLRRFGGHRHIQSDCCRRSGSDLHGARSVHCQAIVNVRQRKVKGCNSRDASHLDFPPQVALAPVAGALKVTGTPASPFPPASLTDQRNHDRGNRDPHLLGVYQKAAVP